MNMYLNLNEIINTIKNNPECTIKAGTVADFYWTGATLYENGVFYEGAFIKSNWDNPVAYITYNDKTVTFTETTSEPQFPEDVYTGENIKPLTDALKAATEIKATKNSTKPEITENIIDIRIEVADEVIYSSIGYGILPINEEDVEIYTTDVVEDLELDEKQIKTAMKQTARQFLNRTNKKSYDNMDLLITKEFTLNNEEGTEEYPATFKAYLCME